MGGNSSRTSSRGSTKKTAKPMPHDRFAARLRSAQIYSQIWGRQGVSGVSGNKFYMILVARELF
ncbi:hypothetical protein JG688_00006856 [Phytophthora aleatoria]|uniref:Uncharacterized protein n=1 Tax=Phytophthora aleatoria TaxID=2496075 RepID=A0A8J5JAL3_9STRA|nr:hypothetical protein JG688_00006856 [Phytophthora aleatoria]